MDGPQGGLWKLTIKGGVERDLKELLGQDRLNDLRACAGCREQMAALAQQMNSEVKDVLLDAESKLNKVSETADADQRELAKVCEYMGLKSGSTQVAPDSGHAIVQKELARHLPQLIACLPQEKLRKNELLVSPDLLPLVERLLAKRLSGKRQPKISDQRVWIDCPSATERSLLSEQEREGILSAFDGLGLAFSLKEKSAKQQEQRKCLEEILSRPPGELAEIEAVSLISFQSRKTKSTGIGAKYKFKLKMIPMRKHGEKAGSSAPGCDGDSTCDARPRSQASAMENSGAMSDTSFLLSPSLFEAFANKLGQDYQIEINGQQLCQLFLICYRETQSAAETDSECSSVAESVNGEEARDDSSMLLSEIIERLEPDGRSAPRSLGSFQKHWLTSVQSFGQDVIRPYFEVVPLPTKFEGSEIPPEAVSEIQAALLNAVKHCFTDGIFKVFFIERRELDQHYRKMSKRIIKKSLHVLTPTFKKGLSVEIAAKSWTLDALKKALASEVTSALEKTIQPLLDEVCQFPAAQWISSRPVESAKYTPKPQKHQSGKFRSERARRNEAQIFAPWMQHGSHQSDMKVAFRVTH